MARDPRSDYRNLVETLRLARGGLYTARPNPRVGCVIVRDGAVVGRGFHRLAGGPHAEIVALEAAGVRAAGATVYVTLEPCSHHGRTPPCADALIDARVARVVYACPDPNPRVAGRGAERLRRAGIEVVFGGPLTAARELNRGFLSRHERGRPWLTVKVGMSLDGRTALANGESRWITGPAARADVQRLRALSCAVMTGSGTIRADDPALTVRDARYAPLVRAPLRVVLDTALTVSPAARLFAEPGPVLIFTANEDPDRRAALMAVGADVEVIPAAHGGVALDAVVARLAARECNEVLVESGPRLAGALVAARLVDELVCYVAPRLLGAGARGAFAWADLVTLEHSHDLELVELRRIGSDLRLIARPVPVDDAHRTPPPA